MQQKTISIEKYEICGGNKQKTKKRRKKFISLPNVKCYPSWLPPPFVRIFVRIVISLGENICENICKNICENCGLPRGEDL